MVRNDGSTIIERQHSSSSSNLSGSLEKGLENCMHAGTVLTVSMMACLEQTVTHTDSCSRRARKRGGRRRQSVSCRMPVSRIEKPDIRSSGPDPVVPWKRGIECRLSLAGRNKRAIRQRTTAGKIAMEAWHGSFYPLCGRLNAGAVGNPSFTGSQV